MGDVPDCRACGDDGYRLNPLGTAYCERCWAELCWSWEDDDEGSGDVRGDE